MHKACSAGIKPFLIVGSRKEVGSMVLLALGSKLELGSMLAVGSILVCMVLDMGCSSRLRSSSCSLS